VILDGFIYITILGLQGEEFRVSGEFKVWEFEEIDEFQFLTND